MAVVEEFLTWLLGALSQLWTAISSEWGIVGICFVCVPVVKRLFNLFITMIKGGYE